jgi:hypothetical protein
VLLPGAAVSAAARYSAQQRLCAPSVVWRAELLTGAERQPRYCGFPMVLGRPHIVRVAIVRCRRCTLATAATVPSTAADAPSLQACQSRHQNGCACALGRMCKWQTLSGAKPRVPHIRDAFGAGSAVKQVKHLLPASSQR